MSYQQEYSASITTPEAFWAAKARQLDWFSFPSTILGKDENGIDRWFTDGVLNTAHMALDANVAAGRGDQVAIYYDSPVTNSKQAISYAELTDRVAIFAGALQQQGVKKRRSGADLHAHDSRSRRGHARHCTPWRHSLRSI